MIEKMIFEFIGTMILILMGDGVCANVSLEKSKAKGAGWVVVTFAWGLAVMCGVFVAGPYTGAHLNPAVSIGLALAGTFDWNLVVPYIIAQMLGGFVGAVLVYIYFKDHYDATPDADTKLGTFCTIPAIRRGQHARDGHGQPGSIPCHLPDCCHRYVIGRNHWLCYQSCP